MNISYNWLKEYVNFDLTPDEVATTTFCPAATFGAPHTI